MAYGNVVEREKFTKKKHENEVQRFMKNYEEFTETVKSELINYEYKVKKAEHVVQSLIELREKFDIQQELLLDAIIAESEILNK